MFCNVNLTCSRLTSQYVCTYLIIQCMYLNLIDMNVMNGPARNMKVYKKHTRDSSIIISLAILAP